MSHEHGSAGKRHSRRLIGVLALTSSFMIVEAVTGFLTNSLVLIADAGHMLTDVAGLSLALAAIWFAQRPATASKTYGYYRAEILGALANSLLLFAVAAYILYEAVRRFQSPPDIPSTPLLIVATLGLIVNLIGARLLIGGSGESLNVRGAFLEVLGDLLGSVGAIAAGIILLTTGWQYADPLIAAGVGLFILPRTWNLLRHTLDVLFEGTPANILVPDVQQAILGIPAVHSVHDLHVWTVTSGFVALSGHVGVEAAADRDATLVALRARLQEKFDIEHVTIQIEDQATADAIGQPCFPGQTPCFAPEMLETPPTAVPVAPTTPPAGKDAAS